jgi:hypothetical protein
VWSAFTCLAVASDVYSEASHQRQNSPGRCIARKKAAAIGVPRDRFVIDRGGADVRKPGYVVWIAVGIRLPSLPSLNGHRPNLNTKSTVINGSLISAPDATVRLVNKQTWTNARAPLFAGEINQVRNSAFEGKD